jgi:drug/metabolite transporter (DMT)-like permease
VLIIVRPGMAGFNVYSLVALAAMFFVTLKELTTRIIPRFTPALIVAGAMSLATALASAVYGLSESWIMPEWKHIALLVGASAFLVAGYYTSIIAMRHGDIAVTAPFRYASVISAIIVGFLIWGEVPDALMIIGTTIIIATGIYTFYRERRLALAGSAE